MVLLVREHKGQLGMSREWMEMEMLWVYRQISREYKTSAAATTMIDKTAMQARQARRVSSLVGTCTGLLDETKSFDHQFCMELYHSRIVMSRTPSWRVAIGTNSSSRHALWSHELTEIWCR